MIGVDSWDRPFITLRILSTQSHSYYKNTPYVCVLFQRYSDRKNRWTHSTIGGIEILNESGYFLESSSKYTNNEHANFTHNFTRINIYNLINNKGVIYINKYLPKLTDLRHQLNIGEINIKLI